MPTSSPAPAGASDPGAAEARGAKPPASAPAWREPWTFAAWGLLVLEVGAAIYLGSRPGGRGPVLVYYLAPLVLGAGALVIAALGLAMAARRRPFVQPARIVAFAVLALVVGSASYPLPFPAQREGHSSRVEFDFPLEGEWTVAWGGADSSRNLLARSRADRRFGYDLVLERDGSRHAGDGSRPQDWYAFGRPVFAPCDATVVRVVDGLPDLAPQARSRSEEELGNHVVLQVAPDEYLFLCSLRNGSLRVQVGQEVSRGDPLAEVGSSGLQRFTQGPHLALHLQDTPEPRWGQGVPLAFHDVLLDGEPVDRAQPRGRSLTDPDGTPGQRVRRAP